MAATKKKSRRRTSTVRAQRRLQQSIREIERASPEPAEPAAMQAGARRYPVPPFPRQHQATPGRESALSPAPMYLAPYYRGSDKLKGKVALISGGDSGIGRAVAVLFAREGADIAIMHLAEEKDAAVTCRAVVDEGRGCLVLAGDVAERGFCRRSVRACLKEYGQLDVLVNNAAFQLHAKRIEDLSPAHFDRTIKTNLYGCFHLSQAAIPHLRPGSAILVSGSVTAIRGSKALLDYSMTKGALHSFTRSLASQLLPRGIRVNAVAPGPVWTPLNPADKQAAKVSEFGAHAAMGRPAQPEEIAPAYVFLASPQCSSYITGEVLPIIGGYD